MGVIFSVTLRLIKQNKKRAVLTILAIILSTAMMTVVLNGAYSLLFFLREKEAKYAGDYEYAFYDVSLDEISALSNGSNVGKKAVFALLGNSFAGKAHSNKNLVSIGAVNADFWEMFSLEGYLLEGSFPQNEHEIVIARSFVDRNGLDWKLGDTISLSVGTRYWETVGREVNGRTNYLGSEERFYPKYDMEYEVAGFLADTDSLKVPSACNVFTLINDATADNSLTCYCYIKSRTLTKDVYRDAQRNFSSFSNGEIRYHEELLRYYGIAGSKSDVKMFLAVAVVVLLIIVISAMMIKNALLISLQEKIRYLGMLSSVGATKRQKRGSVAFEGLFWGIFGIPIGLVAGTILTSLSIWIINTNFAMLFSFKNILLKAHYNAWIYLLCAGAELSAVAVSIRKPSKSAEKITVMEAVRQSSDYVQKPKRFRRHSLFGMLFGIYGSLAVKNVYRNPKRFRSVTGSLLLGVIMILTIYSLSDLMTYQISLDVDADGSNYVDVVAFIPYGDMKRVVEKFSDEKIQADLSYHIDRYLEADLEASQINSDMSGYFHGNRAEIYVVGLDRAHFLELCGENSALLFNYAVGDFGRRSGVVQGSPLILGDYAELQLSYSECDEGVHSKIMDNSPAKIQSVYVRDRCVAIVPIAFYEGWLLQDDVYVELDVCTSQHEEVTQCLSEMGYYTVVDYTKATQNTRQMILMAKIFTYVFAVFMVFIATLNICNTIAGTISAREREFAVLGSIGMTKRRLKEILALEAVLYGARALVIGLPVSVVIYVAMYRFICETMTPFPFYIRIYAYILAVVFVAVIVTLAMLFSVQSFRRCSLVEKLKREDC